MKFIKTWFARRRAIKAAEAFVLQGEHIKAIKAYRCSFEPITSLKEAVDAVDILREKHGCPRDRKYGSY